MPYQEIPHTADWSLRVWAEDLPFLFAEAAHGMANLAGVRLSEGPRTQRRLDVQASDPESLLVSFLSEILYIGEQEHLGFDEFEIHLADDRLQADLTGAPILSIDKIIKAVTYHALQIRQTPAGVETEIVFDV